MVEWINRLQAYGLSELKPFRCLDINRSTVGDYFGCVDLSATFEVLPEGDNGSWTELSPVFTEPQYR